MQNALLLQILGSCLVPRGDSQVGHQLGKPKAGETYRLERTLDLWMEDPSSSSPWIWCLGLASSAVISTGHERGCYMCRALADFGR